MLHGLKEISVQRMYHRSKVNIQLISMPDSLLLDHHKGFSKRSGWFKHCCHPFPNRLFVVYNRPVSFLFTQMENF